MRSVLWLYLFLFVAFFDLHAQYPILTPFAISIGAAPSFIGLMMGMYSFTHLPGNLLAGYGIDRFGSRIFIVLSLIGAGVIMIVQAHVVNPWELLVLRSISGFVLAFLSPACLSLLARMARDHVHQGKLMAGNGLIHTLASVVSPAAGAYLVAKIGFGMAFQALGMMLLIVGVLSCFFIRDIAQDAVSLTPDTEGIPSQSLKQPEAIPVPWRFYFMPLAISLSQGILFFELPLLADALESIMRAGILFSAVSLGALFTLSLLFLNRYQPYTRTWMGAFALALLFFGLAIHWPVPLLATLFLIGMTKGIILPAMTSHLILVSGGTRFGKIFSILAIASSIGFFLGPMIAGQIRDMTSPYFIAFVVLMIAVTLLPAKQAFLPPSLLPATRTTPRV
ncbi:MFS transporter [Paenibacillus popilliae]|uniref:Permease n=1 Tax=Paenibacillus popilliae ATCC 14706 TaxID=1212764 RepID=M9M3V8_PAEPP|nr:MFS transporter [Paenibacillus popilliae]GAC41948.1 permease [Paenibacillus popilliae ATCC 14706]